MTGTLFTWTRTWHRFAGTEGIEVPFVIALVELPAAGNRRILGLFDGQAPRIGAPVSGSIAPTKVSDGEIPALHWRIAA